MGVSPWKSSYELWLEKMGLVESSYRSPAMQRGIDLEEEARQEFFTLTGIQVFPKVMINHNLPWQMASLDGISVLGNLILEIKCPGKQDHITALNGKIPEKYIPQLQHQMCVCNAQAMQYFSYSGKNESNVILTIQRDDEYIKKLIEKETEFWQCMQTFTPPTLTERDYTKRTDLEWKNTSYEWSTVQKSLKELEKKEKDLRSRLITMSNGINSCGSGIKVTKIIRKGAVDYDKIPFDVNLEDYRKETIHYWKVCEEKN
jgi:putative phage-type endonuclease